MKIFFTTWPLCLLLGISTTAATNEISLTVVAGAETHAMTEACDCPKDPGGGLAKRSYLLKKMGSRERVLLLDAGGFSGGGLYDSYTEGRAGDSLRTLNTLKGMGAIGYDAVTIGDDDLQYGGKWLLDRAEETGVPLVSANCYTKEGKRLAEPYILVKKGQYTFAVTGVTSPEKLFAVDKNIKVKDPVLSLRSIWKEMKGRSDFQVILSHCGQELSIALKDSFPECDIIVNGHRKADTDAVKMIGAVAVMQFGFQGKSLSFMDLRIKGEELNIVRSGWLDIGPDVPEDSAMDSIITSQRAVFRPVYDLYIMSQCPYGLEALAAFTEFVNSFPEPDWNLWFIGTAKDNGTFSSLHGEEEVKDEMVWLAVKELYPEKWI